MDRCTWKASAGHVKTQGRLMGALTAGPSWEGKAPGPSVKPTRMTTMSELELGQAWRTAGSCTFGGTGLPLQPLHVSPPPQPLYVGGTARYWWKGAVTL